MTTSLAKDLTFEQALLELETIVRQLEEGKDPLEAAITSYEKGVKLKEFCEAKLKDAELKIKKITGVVNGDVKGEEFQ